VNPDQRPALSRVSVLPAARAIRNVCCSLSPRRATCKRQSHLHDHAALQTFWWHTEEPVLRDVFSPVFCTALGGIVIAPPQTFDPKIVLSIVRTFDVRLKLFCTPVKNRSSGDIQQIEPTPSIFVSIARLCSRLTCTPTRAVFGPRLDARRFVLLRMCRSVRLRVL